MDAALRWAGARGIVSAIRLAECAALRKRRIGASPREGAQKRGVRQKDLLFVEEIGRPARPGVVVGEAIEGATLALGRASGAGFAGGEPERFPRAALRGEKPVRWGVVFWAERADGALLVRGDALWLTVPVEPRLLAEGGRITVETPLGRRVVWITKKAGARGLVRLPGQGLPARGRRREGHLFLRLTPQTRTTASAARTLLRRFAAAWAA